LTTPAHEHGSGHGEHGGHSGDQHDGDHHHGDHHHGDHHHGDHHHGPERFQGLSGAVIAATMLTRGAAIGRLVAELAGVAAGDRVLDVGCGPGSAARVAASRGAVVTAVDPAPLMLRVARYLSRGQDGQRVTFEEGTAEALPVSDQAITVAWAISSAHHWASVGAGLREMHRVLVPGGKLIIAERLAKPDARGLGAHGFTAALAKEVIGDAHTAGFTDALYQTHRAGRRTMIVISAHRPAADAG
jgi:ubiquinone/menaquinone biosynthesis C-methylase UbiE